MRSLIACLALFSVAPVEASAQLLDVGVKGGVRGTSDLNGRSLLSGESKRYILGPAVTVNLPLNLGVEVDALFRSFGYSSSSGNFAGFAFIRERSNSWEFPVIGKYRFPLRSLRPFVGAGVNTRTVSGSRVSSGASLVGLGPEVPFFNLRVDTHYPTTMGLVVTGGLEWKLRHFTIAPELRYQRWSQPFLDQVGGGGSYDLHSNQNEAFLILGLSWH